MLARLLHSYSYVQALKGKFTDERQVNSYKMAEVLCYYDKRRFLGSRSCENSVSLYLREHPYPQAEFRHARLLPWVGCAVGQQDILSHSANTFEQQVSSRLKYC